MRADTTRLIDFHTHTYLSGHGEGTVAELVDAAARLGISSLAITEHLPLPKEVDPKHDFSMSIDEIPAYLSDIRQASEAHPNMEIVPGFEIDWRIACEDFVNPMLSDGKMLLLSVHMLSDDWCFDDPSQIDQWDERGADAIWSEYFDLWMQACVSTIPHTTMAHPDLPKKFGIWPSSAINLEAKYREAASLAAQMDVMIEVNTAGWRKPVAEQYPSLEFLRCFSDAGVECSVGSDAHSPTEVGLGIREAYELMRQAGYTHVTYISSDGDRRRLALT